MYYVENCGGFVRYDFIWVGMLCVRSLLFKFGWLYFGGYYGMFRLKFVFFSVLCYC